MKIQVVLISMNGLETVVSVLFTNTNTRWLFNEREIFNTARGLFRPRFHRQHIISFSASKTVPLHLD